MLKIFLILILFLSAQVAHAQVVNKDDRHVPPPVQQSYVEKPADMVPADKDDNDVSISDEDEIGHDDRIERPPIPPKDEIGKPPMGSNKMLEGNMPTTEIIK